MVYSVWELIFFFMVNVYLLQSNLSRTAASEHRKVAVVERWPLWGGRGVMWQSFFRGVNVLPYKGLMGTCGQLGYVFRDFCLKKGIDFIIICLNKGIDFINFCPNQGIFSWTKTSCAYVLRTKLYRVWFRVKRLKQGIKNGNFVLNRVGTAPPQPRIYRVPPPPPPGGSKTCLLCFFNYWMRLSIVWRIMEIEERPKWITLSEITIILQMIRRPNWI